MSEDFENAISLNAEGSESRTPANRLMSLRIAGVVKPNW